MCRKEQVVTVVTVVTALILKRFSLSPPLGAVVTGGDVGGAAIARPAGCNFLDPIGTT
jgi:hypothetical protein